MASSNGRGSFDDIIQAGRLKRKNEKLAQDIFGRRSHTGGITKRGGDPSSLANRITPKGSANSNLPKRKNHNPFTTFRPPSRPSSAAAQHARVNHLASAVNMAHSPLPAQEGIGLSIKGTAGLFLLRASNFSPGTTAADIESALRSEASDKKGNNGIVTCRIISTTPTVTAELGCSERYVADNLISQFNNMMADGRILNIYLARGHSSPPSTQHKSTSAPIPNPTAPSPAPKELFERPAERPAQPMEDVEMITEEGDLSKQSAEPDRTPTGPRSDREFRDGRSGPRDNGFDDDRSAKSNHAPNSAAQRSDDRFNQRDETRGRGYDNQYDRRDDRPNYRRDERQDYGRGEGPGRFGNGSSRRPYRENYGRLYSDNMGRGSGRGEYRNYR